MVDRDVGQSRRKIFTDRTVIKSGTKVPIETVRSFVKPNNIDPEVVDALCWLAVRPLDVQLRADAVGVLLDNFKRRYGVRLAVQVVELVESYNVGLSSALAGGRSATSLTGNYVNTLLRRMSDNCHDAFVNFVYMLADWTFTNKSIYNRCVYQHNETFGYAAGRWFTSFTDEVLNRETRGL